MKPKVVLGLFSLNGAQTVQLGQNVFTQMTGNANFTTPTPALTVLQTKLTAATDKINDYNVAVDEASEAKAARDSALDELRTVLTDLGLYVENTSGGIESKILSAGMNVKAVPAPLAMTQVENLKLEASEEFGEVFARWKAVPGAKSYRVQTCVDADSAPTNWTEKLVTPKSRCSLNHDLVSGSKVWVRVKAVGSNDQGPWSDIGWKTVP